MLVEAPRSANYIERFKVIFAQQAELKAKRAELKQQQAEDTELTSHMELAADTLAEWKNSCYEMTFFNRKSQRTFTCQIVQNTKRHLKRAKTMQISGIGHSVIRGLVTTGQWFSASTTVYPRGSPQGRRHSYFVDC